MFSFEESHAPSQYSKDETFLEQIINSERQTDTGIMNDDYTETFVTFS